MEMIPYLVQTADGERRIEAHVFGHFAAHPAGQGCLQQKETETADQWVVSFCGWRFPIAVSNEHVAIGAATLLHVAYEQSATIAEVEEALVGGLAAFRTNVVRSEEYPDLEIYSELIDFYDLLQRKTHRGEEFADWMGV